MNGNSNCGMRFLRKLSLPRILKRTVTYVLLSRQELTSYFSVLLRLDGLQGG